MKGLMVAVVAAILTLGVGAAAETEKPSVTAEVYVNIPGNQAVHCLDAKVVFLDAGVVQVETPWGVVYTTHLANVVVVVRKNTSKKG